MLEKCTNAKELWGGVHDLIDRWLNERREVIVRMFAIKGLPDSKKTDEPIERRVESFCEILVDYISAGHFEIYEQLMREAREFEDGGIELAEALFPRIQVTTELMLDFNDTYSGAEEVRAHLDTLESDVSQVAEALEERFELEDQLIQALHEVHRDKVLTTSPE
ncbi:sigma D regulator [Salinispirillum sp. LH 10-3-1]|uniref:Sigma D regulator n=1 Tax=Salinispirillum sp. LH 10-3-1 TaxID=2952525 RepID=A0AB38YGA9_9GAMM